MRNTGGSRAKVGVGNGVDLNNYHFRLCRELGQRASGPECNCAQSPPFRCNQSEREAVRGCGGWSERMKLQKEGCRIEGDVCRATGVRQFSASNLGRGYFSAGKQRVPPFSTRQCLLWSELAPSPLVYTTMSRNPSTPAVPTNIKAPTDGGMGFRDSRLPITPRKCDFCRVVQNPLDRCQVYLYSWARKVRALQANSYLCGTFADPVLDPVNLGARESITFTPGPFETAC